MANNYTTDAVELLKKLIATPSVSRSETDAADIMEQAMRDYGLTPQRHGNNLWVTSPTWDSSRPTILLNAHIDTVKPVATWTRDPFTPIIEEHCNEATGELEHRLYGLGSNDCGGGLVALLQVFRQLTSNATSVNNSSTTSISNSNATSINKNTPNSHGIIKGTNLIYLASCE